MILWLNPFSGISGDMLLGALLDLGAPLDEVRAAVASTGMTGWELTVSETHRQSLRGCRAHVSLTGPPAGRRSAAELAGLVSAARPAPVARIAVAAIAALAEAEGHLHGVPPDEVELHELGGTDTVVDTVGVAAAVRALGITQTWSAPVALGAGTVPSAHGLLPAPAPATLALLAGARVAGAEGSDETVTPTGAALLRALDCRYAPVPPITLVRAGYGAGSRDTPGRPNLLPALLGEPAADPADAAGPAGEAGAAGQVEALVVVETTVDDVTGEVLAVTLDRLLGAGALDAWIAPVTGKKGRPAQVVSALCRPPQTAAVQRVLLAETGSLGARRHTVERHALPRTVSEVFVAGHRIRIKTGPYRAKPELDDVLTAAVDTGLPVRTVAERALSATRHETD